MSFNHAWAVDDACKSSKFAPLQQNNFDPFGFNSFDENNFTINNGNSSYEVQPVSETGFDNAVNLKVDSCKSIAIAGSCLHLDGAAFDNGCAGTIQNFGMAQAIGDSTCRSEAYSLSVAGFEVTDDKDLLKGRITWEPTLLCKKKGKGHTVLQKSGSNDPIQFYIKDSITGKDTIITLLSIKMEFIQGADSLTRNNYWKNDTLHIESDYSQFSIIFPSTVTSLKDTLIINVLGDTVSSIIKTGTYATFGAVTVGAALPLHFILNDSLAFRYNLDTLGLLATMGITNTNSLKVTMLMFGNSINSNTSDTTLIQLIPAASNATCNACTNGSATVTAIGSSPFFYMWSNGATTQTITGLMAGVYTVTVIDAAGCTNSVSVTVGVTCEPFTMIASASNQQCSNVPDGVVSVLASGNYPPYSIQWSTGDTTFTVDSLNSGSYYFTVTDNVGCQQSAHATVGLITQVPSYPGPIIGNTVVCKNTNGITYQVGFTNWASSFNWTVGTGGTIVQGQGSPSIIVNWANNTVAGLVTVVAANNCGSSAVRALAYTVSQVPATPATILGPVYGVCKKSNVSYTIPPVVGAFSYVWTVPIGVNIISGQGTNALTVTYTSGFVGTGYITVKAANACGYGGVRNLTVYGKPATPAISGANYACQYQQQVTYTVAPISGAQSYTWTVVPGSTITSGQGTNTIKLNWGSTNGIIKCKAVNACGASANAWLPVSFTCKDFGNEWLQNIIVLPNPANSFMLLNFHSEIASILLIVFYDAKGSVILQKTIKLTEGLNQSRIEIDALPSGLYNICFKTDLGIIRKSIVIEH